jgi:hypothetical protein
MSELDNLTTGEAEAWRAGWRAAIEAAAQRIEPKPWWNAATREQQQRIADREERAAAIRAMQPPERPSKGEKA